MLMMVSELDGKHNFNQFSSKRWKKIYFFPIQISGNGVILKIIGKKVILISPQPRLTKKGNETALADEGKLFLISNYS